jgi:histidinol-phosphate phosphatase family protein
LGFKAVFIDRDGTINVNVDYIDNPDDFQLYPTVAEGIKLLKDNGFKIIVITNQSGIARGFFTEETLKKIHERMKKELSEKHASIDGLYYCPHHPDENCDCRKPNTALFEKAIQEHTIDVSRSFVIGDRMIDVEAGHKIGCKTVLVPERKKMVEQERKESKFEPDYICNDFYSGVLWILHEDKK